MTPWELHSCLTGYARSNGAKTASDAPSDDEFDAFMAAP